MLCAAELLMMKEKAEKDWEKEQERLNAECALEFIEIVENTIKFCEEKIGKDLEEKAEKRLALEVNYRINIYCDRLGNKLFKLVQLDTVRYADGTPSYSPKGNSYSVVALEEFLQSYCYKIEYKEGSYREYGSGYRSCSNLIITI